MRLSLKLNKIHEALNLLYSVYIANTVNSVSTIANFNDLKEAINVLKSVKISTDTISKIENFEYYNRTESDITIASKHAEMIMSEVTTLKNNLEETEKSIKSILNKPEIYDDEYCETEEHSIFVKLPDTNNLGDLAKNIAIYDKILSQSILDANVGGKIELKTVEPGSIWLDICLGSIAAVKLVGAITWASAVILKKHNEAKYTKELVISKAKDNEEKELILKYQERLLDIYIESETENIINEHYINTENQNGMDNEKFARLKNVLDMLFEQMKKGSEIVPALTESEKVENLFPDMKNIPLIESKIKKLDH